MGQYFDNDNLKSKITEYKTKIFDIEFCFNTDNGVFSKSKLDYGTRLLLENIPLQELKGEILEVGSGYGVIPIILSKVCDAKFEGIDVNIRALNLAKINAKKNNCKNVMFYESNCYHNVNKKYDFIITNPPIRAGKEIVYEILVGAKRYLKENASLFLVINKDQGAKTIIKFLENIYEVSILNKNKGFFVIRCDLRWQLALNMLII